MNSKRISIWTTFHQANILFCLLLISLSSSAQTLIEPENGWWYNPTESGYGLNVELQADTLLIGVFSYDQTGNPIWYNTFGSYNNTTGAFSGELLQFGQGPCLGCAYTEPQQTGTLGTIQVNFSSSSQGSVTWNGSSFPIERFNLARVDKPRMLLGGWNIDINILTADILFTSDLLDFYAVAENNGTTVIHGYRATEPRITASGYYYVDENLFAVVVDSPDQFIAGSSNLLTYYEFSFDGMNAIRGTVWQVPRGSTPSGSGLFMVGLRDMQFDNNPPSELPTPIPAFPRNQTNATQAAAQSIQTDVDARVARFTQLAKVLKDR